MKFNPHDYQKEGKQFLIEHPRASLYWEMGLGKSAVVLDTIKDLQYDYLSVDRVLIVAPLLVATVSWPAEILKWDDFKDMRFHVIYGKSRFEDIPYRGITITTYETLLWLLDNKAEVASMFDMVVFDESTYLKNENSLRWSSAFSLFNGADRIVMLTGTPIPNGIADLWAPTYILDEGKRLGMTRTAFREKYFTVGGYNGMKYIPRKGSLNKVLEKVKDISHTIRTEDYLKMPDLIVNRYPVELKPGTKGLYDEMEKKFFTDIEGEQIVAQTCAAKSNKLRQITCGFSYDQNGEALKIRGANEKLEALKEIIAGAPHEGFLIVAEFRELAAQLKKALPNCGVINGDTSVAESRRAITGWNAGKIKRLVVHPGSIAYGVNMQFGGRMIVWMGPTWDLSYWLQLNKRIHRQGQTKPVIVNVLTAIDTVDEVVANRLSMKGRTQDDLIEGIKEYWNRRRVEHGKKM